jgi:hypothetical protein
MGRGGEGGESEREKGDAVRWQCGKKTFMPSKIYRTAMPTHPPITLTTGPRNPRVHKTTYAPQISTAPKTLRTGP